MGRGKGCEDTEGLLEGIREPIGTREATQVPTKASSLVSAFAITVEPHPDPEAHSIEMARVGGYASIVKKGQYKSGDVAIYIPEQSVVPEKILLEMGLYKRDDEGNPLYKEETETGERYLAGGLAGPRGNRVKAVRLRGALSQGLVYTPSDDSLGELEAGKDYTEVIGVTKWMPPIPIGFAGRLESCGSIRSYTDIENFKRFPNVLTEGEEVICTEKLHGTCSIFHFDAEVDRFFVSSKGMAKQGAALVNEVDDHGRSKNVYWRAANLYEVGERLREIAAMSGAKTVALYGETVGVQDLKYGQNSGEVGFAAFDLAFDGEYVDYDQFKEAMDASEIPTVPLLYRGPYSQDKMWEVASGKEQYTGTESHMREGIVTRPVSERYDPEVGRVCLKFVSDDYLLRKNKDATEFE
jgi:RNA ligase (TIGR02306 family)